MIERLRRLLAGLPDSVQWQIVAACDRETQLYHIGARPEARRLVEDGRTMVRLHHRHPTPDGLRQGSAAWYAFPWDGSAELRRRLAAGLEQASLIHELPWDLPHPAAFYPPVAACADNELEQPEAALAEAAGAILAAAAAEPGIEASHFELSLRDRRLTVLTSAGVELAGRSSLASLYGVLVAEAGGRRLDHKLEAHRRSLAGLDLARATAEACRFARDTLQADRLPATGIGPVAISHAGLDHLLNPILAHAEAGLHLAGLARFRPGRPILDETERGETLTLLSDGLLPMGTATEPFSAEGLPPQRHVVIEDGQLRAVMCPVELAGRLALPVTGPFANVVVPGGRTPLAELLADGPVLHVVAFSELLPDRVTGDLAGEIRLAYELRGGRRRPVRGGAVSGNLFAALAEVKLSAETAGRGHLLLPAVFRFEHLTVAGG